MGRSKSSGKTPSAKRDYGPDAEMAEILAKAHRQQEARRIALAAR